MSWIGKNRAISAVDWIEENKPQDGPFIVFYKDNPISVTTDINESKNKQVRWEMHFKGGKRADGNSYGWFWDGTIKQILGWKNNKKHGANIRFYPNGMVVDQWNYKNGIRDGIWISRNKDGSIRKKTIYDNGKTK
tara:strand:+ start:2096 stop:2500 length:405 start_codon:yes stop_codon:yes gene_type:complete